MRTSRAQCGAWGRSVPFAAVALALALMPAMAAGVEASGPLERATASVVAITAGADRIGSGVVIGSDRVLTVSHVVDAGEAISARILVDDRLLSYDVVAIDRDRDLALLAADLPADVPAIEWGDSAVLERGQDVIAIGFPIGLRSVSLTKGVVSSPNQTYGGMEFIQTDAAINPGNSGGPLVDEQGRLVGINVAKIASVEVDAVGFSIPASDALDFLRREAPELEVLVGAAPGEAPREPEPTPVGSTSNGVPIAVLAAITLVAVAAVIVGRMALVRSIERRTPGPEAGAASAGQAGTPASGRVVDRAVFHVSTPREEREFDLRLPSVAGTAPNADIPVIGEEANAYQVRFAIGPDGSVQATNLADETGMYCGDECVPSALMRPGTSVRVGATTVTLVRTYSA